MRVDDMLGAQGRHLRVLMSASMFYSVPGLVERSDLMVLVPARMVKEDDSRLCMLALRLSVTGFTIHMARRNCMHRDAAQRW